MPNIDGIVIDSALVWDYFLENKKELESYIHKIASSTIFGTEIYITNTDGHPCFMVTQDEYTILEQEVHSKEECSATARELYDDYLTDRVVTILSGVSDGVDEDELTAMEIEDIIDEREGILDAAAMSFVLTVTDDNFVDVTGEEFDALIDDLKEHFLEYLYKKHGISVYRPMYLEFEDGTVELSEYPYEEMDFEEE